MHIGPSLNWKWLKAGYTDIATERKERGGE